MEDYLTDKTLVALDTETTGVLKASEIIGFSVCSELEVAYYVILSYWDPTQEKLIYLETMQGAKAFFEKLKTKNLIGQNFIFDASMIFNNFGVELIQELLHDTLISGHLLNENRSNALKERAVALYGEDAKKEQAEMKASVSKNGGALTKDRYELYKADADLIAYYGAKDALLTLKIFYEDVCQLGEENLDKFFYEDESMPLFKGPTYEMNTTGLRVDMEKLLKLKCELETEILQAKAFIYKEIEDDVKDKYPGTSKVKTFNISASKQIAWLLFDKLGVEFNTLTDEGRALCKALSMKLPYSAGAKREFIQTVKDNFGRVYEGSKFNYKTKKMSRPKKVADYWHYLACGKETLSKIAPRYKWVAKFLEYAKASKLLSTYVEGIESRAVYNIIRPSFLQHGTTSGRYSSKAPNFQNLPREDKRVKACIVARPGKVFVGADYEQLEPRVFASASQDETLMACFAKGEDFYSVVGAPIFGKTDCTLFKKDKNFFGAKYPKLRDISKAFALATPYGTSPYQQHIKLGLPTEECEDIIERYFATYPKVEAMILESHEQAKANGVVHNLFGRPRRIPAAMDIIKGASHRELGYEQRNLLNLSMNHRVQSTAASIMNRAAVAVWKKIQNNTKTDLQWSGVKIVMQVHDELILEGPKELGEAMVAALKDAMENTVKLPGVALKADPKIATNLADLK